MSNPKWYYEPGKGVEGGRVFDDSATVPAGWLDSPTDVVPVAAVETPDAIRAQIAALEAKLAALNPAPDPFAPVVADDGEEATADPDADEPAAPARRKKAAS